MQIRASKQPVVDLPNAWTPIATRARDAEGVKHLLWQELPDAPIGVPEAQELLKAKKILMANRHNDDRVELVIRPTVMEQTSA
jgi:hypothetical protein